MMDDKISTDVVRMMGQYLVDHAEELIPSFCNIDGSIINIRLLSREARTEELDQLRKMGLIK